jgi:hypothetical protein
MDVSRKALAQWPQSCTSIWTSEPLAVRPRAVRCARSLTRLGSHIHNSGAIGRELRVVVLPEYRPLAPNGTWFKRSHGRQTVGEARFQAKPTVWRPWLRGFQWHQSCTSIWTSEPLAVRPRAVRCARPLTRLGSHIDNSGAIGLAPCRSLKTNVESAPEVVRDIFRFYFYRDARTRGAPS